MRLELEYEEATLLVRVMQEWLSDLHSEISHTDSRAFREALRHDERLVKGVLGRIEPAVVGPAHEVELPEPGYPVLGR